MQDKLEKYLYKKYPQLFINESKSMKETCMCWGISCGDGWFLLIDRLCSSITRHIKSQHEQIDWHDKWDAEKVKKGEPVDPRPEWAKEKTPQVHFDQVKEKFGSLRIYATGGDAATKEMIDFTESLSRFVCEDCGKFDLTVGSTSKGWIHSVCDECASKEKDYKKNRRWALFKENAEAAKVMKRALKEQEKRKGKEMAFMMKKVKEIEKRSKGKNQKTTFEKQLWGKGNYHGVDSE